MSCLSRLLGDLGVPSNSRFRFSSVEGDGLVERFESALGTNLKESSNFEKFVLDGSI
jgi:hypothetical protein